MSKYVALFIGILLVGLFPATAAARNLITTPAGCNQQFKGDKGSRAACNACVKGKQRYKKSPRGGWSCTGGSSGGGTSGMKKSEMIAITPQVKPPKTLSKHYKTYVTIPAGTFTIGSPPGEPDREGSEGQANVTITRPFLMKTTEVTHGEWHYIMGERSGSYSDRCGNDCPVARVTFREVLEYLNKISIREKLEPCYDLSGKLAV